MVGHAADYGLDNHGFYNLGTVHWNLSTSRLYEEAIRRREGQLAHLGPIVIRTGHHTGRSPNDKFVVREKTTEDKIWWSKVNKEIAEDKYESMYRRLIAYMQGRDCFVQDCIVGAHPDHQIPIRIITEDAWQSMFSRNMFIQVKDREKLKKHKPEFTVIAIPRFHAIPELDGTRSEVFIIVNFGQRTVLIGGSAYGGEIKKSVFTFLNFLLPQKEVLSMHCSANVGKDGDDVALFFGLSATGKTTLSADRGRRLIGDDEHGWSDEGIFNFEGGCYAKMIKLSAEAEPDIYDTTRRFGTLLENVMMDANTRRLNLDDDSLTENTRGAYPLTHIDGAVIPSYGPHPKNIMFLTADAFGVLPPISKLTPAQAKYYFLLGYTAKVAGTEKGIIDPEATFSACFGAPFLALPPSVYAELLGKRIKEHSANCWLVNTGWSGGPYGVGERMPIKLTRSLIRAALAGKLDDVPTKEDPIFGLHVPESCEGVPTEMLFPRNTWDDKDAYDVRAKDLARQFVENFAQYEKDVEDDVKVAGPKV